MENSIPDPNKEGFTLYSKSGCIQCTKLKEHLKAKNLLFSVIDCDEYLFEDKDMFLAHMYQMTNVIIKQFPIVFYEGNYVGSYNEAITFVSKLLVSFEDTFSF